MAPKVEDPDDSGWHHAGESGGLYRFVVEDYVPPDVPIETVQPVNDGSGMLTTAAFNSAVSTVPCDVCSRPIAARDFPTPGARIGSLVCGACSEASNRPSLVTRAMPKLGRPRKARGDHGDPA